MCYCLFGRRVTGGETMENNLIIRTLYALRDESGVVIGDVVATQRGLHVQCAPDLTCAQIDRAMHLFNDALAAKKMI